MENDITLVGATVYLRPRRLLGAGWTEREAVLAVETRYIFIVSMDVAPEKEDLFNEVYDEHVAHLLAVPGVHAVTRMKGEAFGLAIAGTVRQMPAPSPVYTALYEVEGPAVLEGEAWAEAVEKGRWGAEVRPYTQNRSHALYRKL